jgi:hypothetical protein
MRNQSQEYKLTKNLKSLAKLSSVEKFSDSKADMKYHNKFNTESARILFPAAMRNNAVNPTEQNLMGIRPV